MEKVFPEQFIEPVVHLVYDLSLSGKPEILGSAADRTILYSADYDINDTIEYSPDVVKKFQEKIKHLHGMKSVRVGDIKSGVMTCWNILEDAHVTGGKVLGYNYEVAKAKSDTLFKEGIITKEEHSMCDFLLKPHPTALDLLVAKKETRFGIVRWTPKDVEAGFVKLRDGSTLALKDAFQQKAMTKVDIIAWTNSRFAELEMLYIFTKHKKPINPVKPAQVLQEIKESLLIFASQGNWMKVAKRMYSLSKRMGSTTLSARLRDVFNSDLGRLYAVLSDAETIKVLQEEAITKEEKEHMNQEIDGFRERLSVVTLPELLKPMDPFDPRFIQTLQSILQPKVKEELLRLKLLPLPAKWKA